MSIAGRLNGLEKRLPRPSTQVVVIKVAWKPERAGEIERTPTGLVLSVPSEHAEDPRAGLTDEQEAAIEPDARIIVVAYTKQWRDDPTPSHRRRAWDELRGNDEPPDESEATP